MLFDVMRVERNQNFPVFVKIWLRSYGQNMMHEIKLRQISPKRSEEIINHHEFDILGWTLKLMSHGLRRKTLTFLHLTFDKVFVGLPTLLDL